MSIMSNLRNALINNYLRAVRMLYGVKKDKVLFTSFFGKSYSDNPRAVSEALHELAPEAEIVWLLNKGDQSHENTPEYIRCVDANNPFQVYKEWATSAVCVNNFSFLPIPKSKKQKFVQTWHGDKGFKKILHDSPMVSSDFSVSEQMDGFCDLMIAGSALGERVCQSAFRYKGRILMEGTPRNDRLVQNDPDLRRTLKQTLNIAEDTRLLLYAPTLRRKASQNKQKQQIQELDISVTLDLLEKRDNCKWICLLRAHPSMVGLCGVGVDSRMMDVSGYEDMADLLLISDMLITDYSSCAGDFALLRRALVLYQPDRQEYVENDRTFYFDIDESPYIVAQNQQELESPFSNTGNSFKTDVFEVEAYCWDTPDHWWNFKYKNFEAAWYKHLSRGFEYRMVDGSEITLEFLENMISECFEAIQKYYR